MKLIDADLFLEEINKGATIEDLKKLVTECKGVPVTVDTEPVVRCKDCFYLDEDEFENGDVVLFCNFMRAELNDMEMNNESYCSNGERKEP